MAKKIIYWIATAWLALAMLASGLQQIFHTKAFADIMASLSYPPYFSSILGIWKMLGVIVILLPGFKLFKEWAYSGFFFVMSGALFSHLAMGHSISELIPALTLIIMVILSWYFRPASRKIVIE